MDELKKGKKEKEERLKEWFSKEKDSRFRVCWIV